MALWQVKHVAKVHWKHYTGSWLGDAGNFTNIYIKITQHCFKTIHTKLIHTKLISSKTTTTMSRFMSKNSTPSYSCCCNLVILGDFPFLQITSCRNRLKSSLDPYKSPSPCLFILVWESTILVIIKHAWFIYVHLLSPCYLWKVSVYQQSPNFYWLISISHKVRSSLIVSWLIFHDYCWVAIIHLFLLLVTLHITPLLVESAMFAAMFCWWPWFFLTFSGWKNTRCGEILWSKKAPKSQKGSSCRCYCLGGVAGSCVPGSKR